MYTLAAADADKYIAFAVTPVAATGTLPGVEYSSLFLGPVTVASSGVDCTDTATTGVPQIQCGALMALYNSTDGANWADNSGWNTATAVDSWYGVIAASISTSTVRVINLYSNSLTGIIPPELGNLSALTLLNLQSLYQN